MLLWTLVAGGDEVREALRVCRSLEQRSVPRTPEGLERFARLGATEAQRVAEAHAVGARARLDRILG